jgi:hypothetical protein
MSLNVDGPWTRHSKKKRLAEDVFHDTVAGYGIVVQGFDNEIVRVEQNGVENLKRVGMRQRGIDDMHGEIHLSYVFYRLGSRLTKDAHHDQRTPVRPFPVTFQDRPSRNEQDIVGNHDESGEMTIIGWMVEKLVVAGELRKEVGGNRNQGFLLRILTVKSSSNLLKSFIPGKEHSHSGRREAESRNLESFR